jgi:transposase-like protein
MKDRERNGVPEMNEITCPRCLSGQLRIIIQMYTVYFTCLDCGKSWQEELRGQAVEPAPESRTEKASPEPPQVNERTGA